MEIDFHQITAWTRGERMLPNTKGFSLSFAVLISLLMSIFATNAASSEPEKYYVEQWCAERGGEIEYHLPDGTRCDCVTPAYAIEFDFGHKFYEAIGQAFYYASKLNKHPGIVLILEKKQDVVYWKRLKSTLRYWHLPIRIWAIKGWR